MKKTALILGVGLTAIIPLSLMANKTQNSYTQYTYEEEVLNGFAYEATRTLAYTFEPEQLFDEEGNYITGGPNVTITEDIQIVDTNANDGISLDDFVGIDVTLTGIDSSITYEPMMPWEATAIYTEVHWTEQGLTQAQVDEFYPWYSTGEKQEAVGKQVYCLQFWEDINESNPGKVYIGDITGAIANPVKKAIPKPIFNPLINTNFTYEQLTGNSTSIWKEAWTKEQDSLSLISTYEIYSTLNSDHAGSTKEEAVYGGWNYYDWLNLTFLNWGDANGFNSGQANGGYGNSVLEYTIDLVDTDGKEYEITKGIPDDTSAVVALDQLIIPSSINILLYGYGTNDVSISFMTNTAMIKSGEIDLDNYALEMRIIYFDKETGQEISATEYSPLKNPPVPYNTENYVLKPGDNKVVVTIDERALNTEESGISFKVEIRDANHPELGTSSGTGDGVDSEKKPIFDTWTFIWWMIGLGTFFVTVGIYYFVWFFINKSKTKKRKWNPFSKENALTLWFTKNKDFKQPEIVNKTESK